MLLILRHTSGQQAKAKSESLAADDADWFANTQPDSHSSDGGSQKGWKGSGRGHGQRRGRWQRGAIEWWTERSDWGSSAGGGGSQWDWNDDDSSRWGP